MAELLTESILDKERQQKIVGVVDAIENYDPQQFQKLATQVEGVFSKFGVQLSSGDDLRRSEGLWQFDMSDWVSNQDKSHLKADFELEGRDGTYANFYIERFKFEDAPDPRLGKTVYKVSPGACSIRDPLPFEATDADKFYLNFQKSIGADHWPMGAVNKMKNQEDDPNYFFISDGNAVNIPVNEAQQIEIAMNRLSGHKI